MSFLKIKLICIQIQVNVKVRFILEYSFLYTATLIIARAVIPALYQGTG